MSSAGVTTSAVSAGVGLIALLRRRGNAFLQSSPVLLLFLLLLVPEAFHSLSLLFKLAEHVCTEQGNCR